MNGDDRAVSQIREKVELLLGERSTGEKRAVRLFELESASDQLILRLEKFAKDAAAASAVPVGAIFPFGGDTAPDGFLLCDGAAVSRTAYADLFAKIGTKWGVGDGSTTFNAPDLRGAFLRGAGAGLNPATRAVGSYEADAFTSHGHTATVTETAHTHDVAISVGNTASSFFGTGTMYSGGTTTTNGATTGVTVSIDNAGGAETRPKNYAVHYIIKT